MHFISGIIILVLTLLILNFGIDGYFGHLPKPQLSAPSISSKSVSNAVAHAQQNGCVRLLCSQIGADIFRLRDSRNKLEYTKQKDDLGLIFALYYFILFSFFLIFCSVLFDCQLPLFCLFCKIIFTLHLHTYLLPQCARYIIELLALIVVNC